MQITVDQEFRAELIEKIRQREFGERTGVHCSDLIFCLNKAMLRKFNEVIDDDNQILLYSLGWSTQRWLVGQDKDEPEKEVDGIKVTLDALADGFPWECKASFQSNQKPIEENTYQIRQLMAQCYVTGVHTGRLSRLEILGNWKSVFGKKEEKNLPENRKPTLTAYKFEFDQKELDANWKWLLERKEAYEKILETRELLPKVIAIPTGQTFECGRCVFAEKECSL